MTVQMPFEMNVELAPNPRVVSWVITPTADDYLAIEVAAGLVRGPLDIVDPPFKPVRVIMPPSADGTSGLSWDGEVLVARLDVFGDRTVEDVTAVLRHQFGSDATANRPAHVTVFSPALIGGGLVAASGNLSAGCQIEVGPEASAVARGTAADAYFVTTL